MNAVIRSTLARLNSSPSPPHSPSYMGGDGDEDVASLHNLMTFTPSAVVEDLFGRGEEVGGDGEGVMYFKGKFYFTCLPSFSNVMLKLSASVSEWVRHLFILHENVCK